MTTESATGNIRVTADGATMKPLAPTGATVFPYFQYENPTTFAASVGSICLQGLMANSGSQACQPLTLRVEAGDTAQCAANSVITLIESGTVTWDIELAPGKLTYSVEHPTWKAASFFRGSWAGCIMTGLGVLKSDTNGSALSTADAAIFSLVADQAGDYSLKATLDTTTTAAKTYTVYM